MSYASVTAKNSHQTPAQARAPAMPEIEHDHSTSSLVDVDSPHVNTVSSDFENAKVKTETQAKRIESEMEDEAKKLDAQARKAASKAKKEGKADYEALKKNKDNPVVIGNAILYIALAGGLGYGAYVKQRVGELSWSVVGLGVGIVGAFGIVDYYASQYLFKKYPPKK